MKSATQTTLDANIEASVISTRQQANTTLSYLETWYVIDRMNQVIGQGNWAYQVGALTKVFEGEVEQYSGKAFATSYTATVSVMANIDGKTVIFSDVGFGDGTDKKNPGKAHEMATKGAVSDGLKRAAKNLGRSMGLALYDKTQEYVTDSEKDTPTIQKAANTPSEAVVKTSKNNATTISGVTKDLITSAFKVLEAQKKITKEAFKMNYLGNKGISTIPAGDLPAIYEKMKVDFPHLNGNGKGA